MILAGEGDAHLLQSLAGLRGMSKPDFRRVPAAVESRCFDGPQRHRSAEHDDRPGFRKRILHHEPAAHAEENHHGEDQAGAKNGGKNEQGA